VSHITVELETRKAGVATHRIAASAGRSVRERARSQTPSPEAAAGRRKAAWSARSLQPAL
jgi:hypothetical protein